MDKQAKRHRMGGRRMGAVGYPQGRAEWLGGSFPSAGSHSFEGNSCELRFQHSVKLDFMWESHIFRHPRILNAYPPTDVNKETLEERHQRNEEKTKVNQEDTGDEPVLGRKGENSKIQLNPSHCEHSTSQPHTLQAAHVPTQGREDSVNLG